MSRLARGATFALLLLQGACSRRPPAAGRADEYAVWSAAIDAEFGGTELHTLSPAPGGDNPFLPRPSREELRYLGRRGITPEMFGAMAPRSRAEMDVDLWRLETRRVRVLPVAALPEIVRTLLTDGTLYVSRAGFGRPHRRAVVSVWANCGSLCGRGAVMLLERGADGRSRVVARLWEGFS